MCPSHARSFPPRGGFAPAGVRGLKSCACNGRRPASASRLSAAPRGRLCLGGGVSGQAPRQAPSWLVGAALWRDPPPSLQGIAELPRTLQGPEWLPEQGQERRASVPRNSLSSCRWANGRQVGRKGGGGGMCCVEGSGEWGRVVVWKGLEKSSMGELESGGWWRAVALHYVANHINGVRRSEPALASCWKIGRRKSFCWLGLLLVPVDSS